jgi:hypothetical protein
VEKPVPQSFPSGEVQPALVPIRFLQTLNSRFITSRARGDSNHV